MMLLDFRMLQLTLGRMGHICEIVAREVLDSRGTPTIEVEVACDDGSRGRAIVPSGASTGRYEAVELRDGDPARYNGKGVRRAVENVRAGIAPEVIGLEVDDQVGIDRRMIQLDGTPNKSRLGANAILGVSLACAHAAAASRKRPLFQHLVDLWAKAIIPPISHQQSTIRDSSCLPLPMVNMISGGLHAGGNLDLQDFLVVPVGAASYREALGWLWAVYENLRHVLAQRGYESALVGDEGGFGPRLRTNREALELIVDAIAAARLEPLRDVAIALDVASSRLFEHGRYRLAIEADKSLSAKRMVDVLAGWVGDFPIVSIEDGCAEDDWDGWRLLTHRLGDRVQLIGDDLFVTNPRRLALGIERRVANAVLIKPNQVGTLTETLEVIAQAKAAGYRTIISARSGETEDTTITHLAVATAAGQIKIGSIARSERLAKYNELLRIEESLGDPCRFAANTLMAGPKRFTL